MMNHESTRNALQHCMREECIGCPYRNTKGCVRRMAFGAKQLIDQLMVRNAELEQMIHDKKIEEA